VEGDTVRVDFNQAVLPLHVFSRAFPCPLAPEGNHLPVPVPVGERAPVYDESEGTREAMSTDIKDTAIRYLRRLEAGDYAGMRALCTDTATVWHNDGKGQQTIDENLAMLEDGPAAEASLRYDITRQFAEADEVLQQHVLHITNADGPVGEVQAAMYFRFQDGLIDRIEEYANFIPATG
jgi:ketosteroid isomerase-like protein